MLHIGFIIGLLDIARPVATPSHWPIFRRSNTLPALTDLSGASDAILRMLLLLLPAPACLEALLCEPDCPPCTVKGLLLRSASPLSVRTLLRLKGPSTCLKGLHILSLSPETILKLSLPPLYRGISSGL
mmetsp:Transcript_41652/g.101666  ORF Transcript_41652/g.101666 Transcript_41652/m.101666 type:complete len:129 (-) Transcript_41652:485-871(-)